MEVTGGAVRQSIGAVQVVVRSIWLCRLPTLASVKLHPVVLSILYITRVLKGLGEEVTQIVVVGSVLEAEVSNVCEVLGELLCNVG